MTSLKFQNKLAYIQILRLYSGKRSSKNAAEGDSRFKVTLRL